MARNDDSRVARFARATAPHHQTLFGIAVALCHDRDQAADLTQETLVRAFEAFDRFKTGSPVLPWLRRILRNLYLDSFKTGRSRHEVAQRDLPGGQLPVAEGDELEHSPAALLERAEASTWVAEEIAELDADHREVLTLCIMQELSYGEAAEVLQVPVGTVASRLGRARARLRQRLLARTSEHQNSPESEQNSPESERDSAAVDAEGAGGRRHG